jgi:hypothetical protein
MASAMAPARFAARAARYRSASVKRAGLRLMLSGAPLAAKGRNDTNQHPVSIVLLFLFQPLAVFFFDCRLHSFIKITGAESVDRHRQKLAIGAVI